MIRVNKPWKNAYNLRKTYWEINEELHMRFNFGLREKLKKMAKNINTLYIKSKKHNFKYKIITNFRKLWKLRSDSHPKSLKMHIFNFVSENRYFERYRLTLYNLRQIADYCVCPDIEQYKLFKIFKNNRQNPVHNLILQTKATIINWNRIVKCT